jgi:hypothetical protein
MNIFRILGRTHYHRALCLTAQFLLMLMVLCSRSLTSAVYPHTLTKNENLECMEWPRLSRRCAKNSANHKCILAPVLLRDLFQVASSIFLCLCDKILGSAVHFLQDFWRLTLSAQTSFGPSHALHGTPSSKSSSYLPAHTFYTSC